MEKMETLLKVDLLNRATLIKDEKKKTIIKTIIKKDKWYLDVEIEMFISILSDLGIDKETAFNLYKQLIINQ